MIVRLAKEDRSRFVILDITAARDPRLSLKAVGLHTYLMTMADGWEVRIAQLIHDRQEGRDAIQGAFRELSAAGYAELRRKTEGGKIVGSEWVIFEKPVDPSGTLESPADGFSGRRENRPPENRPAKEQSSEKNDQFSKEEQIPLFASKPDESTSSPEAKALKIYQAYPRKVDKKKGLKAISAALKKVGFDELLKAVERWAAECKTKATPDDRIPYPATWFNGERWTEHEQTNQHDNPNKPGWLNF